jgi:hypothetical protein
MEKRQRFYLPLEKYGFPANTDAVPQLLETRKEMTRSKC